MSVEALYLAEKKQSGPVFLPPSRGWIGCWFLQAPRAAILLNEREKLGEKSLCFATEFGADFVTSLGHCRCESSFILVTETTTMFFLSKKFQHSNSP